jgi:hypothetical protein
MLLLGLIGVGSAGAAEIRHDEKDVNPTLQRQEGNTTTTEGQGKDPLQFGPFKVGLDAMLRGESATNFNFTDFTLSPGNSDQRMLLRIRPSLTFAPTDYISARIEGQWYTHNGDTDSDKVSFYQGFLEAGLPGRKVVVRAGRQELVYGSAFMLGADGFFDGLSFDAVKLGLKPVEPLAIDLFAGKYARVNSGGIAGELYGIHGTYAMSDDLALDLYGFLDTGGEGLTHEGKDERTFSVGARFAGKLGRHVAFELEPVYQFGRHVENSAHRDISAFGGHVDLTVARALGRYPCKGGLSYAFGSGDGDRAGGKFGEFHNPNNDTPLIGDMSVVGDLSGVTAIDPAGSEVHASGLHVVTAGGGVDVTEKLNVSLSGHYFRAVRTPAGISRDVGFETNLILTYKLTDQVSLLASANRFFTGSFFSDATGSGKEINYGYLQAQATF